MNILLTSVGRRSYLVKYFKEALSGEGKVYVSNSTNQSPAFQVADGYIVTPLIYDDNYIPFLLGYCKENHISAIISLFDIDLPILSKNKKLFENNGIVVIVSDYEVIEKCNDKYLTYNFLAENGFNSPKTYIDFESAKNDISLGLLEYPLFVKPRWGMGSISVFEAADEEELEIFYKKVKRELLNSYLKYESSIDIDRAVLIQEKLNGQEYGLDVINNLKGEYQNTIVKKKIAMRSGETDCAVTLDIPSLKNLGQVLSAKLGHIANLDVDVFVVDDKPYVLEMNARFGGGYPFSHMAGVNLPKAIVNWINGIENDDILTANSNVMCQKDIRLVQLNNVNNIEYKYDCKFLINFALEQLQHQITPTLLERNIDVCEYSKKLNENGRTIVALRDGRIVGIVAGYINNEYSYVSLIIVNENDRGLRIGKQLLYRFEQLSINNGVKFIKLEVRKNNYNAINFYKHFGYKIIGEASDTSYYMVKDL